MPVRYHITVQGHLDQRWSVWFQGLTITNGPNGEAVIAGPIADQAALHGVLAKIRDLGLTLITVQRVVQHVSNDRREGSDMRHDP